MIICREKTKKTVLGQAKAKAKRCRATTTLSGYNRWSHSVWPDLPKFWQKSEKSLALFDRSFRIWQNFEPTFGTFFWRHWANFNCSRRPNVAKNNLAVRSHWSIDRVRANWKNNKNRFQTILSELERVSKWLLETTAHSKSLSSSSLKPTPTASKEIPILIFFVRKKTRFFSRKNKL